MVAKSPRSSRNSRKHGGTTNNKRFSTPFDDIVTSVSSEISVDAGITKEETPEMKIKREMLQKAITNSIVDKVLMHRFEKKNVTEMIRYSQQRHIDIKPQLKDLVNQLANATASSKELNDRVNAVAILRGLEENEIPSHDELRQIARNDIATKLHELSLNDFKHAEEELSITLEECRKDIITTLVTSRDSSS